MAKTRYFVQIQRPNGDTEVVDMTDKPCMSLGMYDTLFAKMRAATKAAGRGDMLKWWSEVDPAAQAAAKLSGLREQARIAKRDGRYVDGNRLTAEADALEAAYLADHPEHAASTAELKADISAQREAALAAERPNAWT